jgi:methionyl aminopeptidase
MTIDSEVDFRGMQRVGKLVARTIEQMRQSAQPGTTTLELDEIAERFARANGAQSAPQITYGFPRFTCISVNAEVVHGIPKRQRIQPGDVVKLDVSLELDGYFADSAITVLVPPVTREALLLKTAAKEALSQGMKAARNGQNLSFVGGVIEQVAKRRTGFVIRELTGHGVGKGLHESPHEIPNWADPRAKHVLKSGQVLAIEPMFSMRPTSIFEEADGWTLTTKNGSLAVHQEHTIMVREGAPIIFTSLM